VAEKSKKKVILSLSTCSWPGNVVLKLLLFHPPFQRDLLHLLENMFDQKHISANPSSNPNPKAQTDKMMPFFDKVYRYAFRGLSSTHDFFTLQLVSVSGLD